MIRGLGDKLQKLRISSNLSQKEVADIIGSSASIISNYESGVRVPSVENLMSLAVLFGCSTDYLLDIDKSDMHKWIDASMLDDAQYMLLKQLLHSLQK